MDEIDKLYTGIMDKFAKALNTILMTCTHEEKLMMLRKQQDKHVAMLYKHALLHEDYEVCSAAKIILDERHIEIK